MRVAWLGPERPGGAGMIGDCLLCKARRVKLCPDGACKPCHVSVTWTDCLTGTDIAERLLSLGHPRSEVKKLYPRARI